MKTKINGFLTLLLAFVMQFTFAQEKIISGKVSDKSGILPGVSIIIKGTNKGVDTDFDGNYTIKAKEGDVLQFSYVGMATKLVTVTKTNTLNVTLKASANALQEVVITGYGSENRDIITSGISTITSSDLAQVPSTSNMTNALQGKAAGVVVTAANGKPGQYAFVRIRGTGSINAGQSPLYLVDGVPVDETQMNLVNTSDIKSISILKDAAASSIYGARASNGVVVITTKTGHKKQKARITFSSQTGFSQKTKDNFTMMDASQKLQYEKEIGKGTGSSIVLKSELDSLTSLNHNWQDDLLKQGFIQSNGISVAGGGDKSNYFVSFKREKNTGIIDGNDGFKRTTGRINFGTEANKWLSLHVNSAVSQTLSEDPRDRNNVQNPFSAMYAYNAYEPLYDLDSNGNPKLDTNGDPIYNLTHQGFSISEGIRHNTSSVDKLKLISNVSLDIKLMDNLIFTPSIGLTYLTSRGESYTEPGSVLDGYVGDPDAPGSKLDDGSYNFTYDAVNKLTYKKSFNKVHNIKVTLLNEFYKNNYRSYRLRSKGYPSPKLTTQDNSAEPTEASSYRDISVLSSYAGVFNYNYKTKYIFSGSFRKDGSSVFGENNKWGTFWSTSAAWNISKESFFKASFVNNLKLRVSYGTVGNDRLPDNYGYLGTYKFRSYNGKTAAYPGNVANPDLKWEQKAMFDAGVDFELFNSRLRGAVDYYSSKTTDLLFKENLAQETGEPGFPASRYANFGALSSKGLDVELTGDIIQNKNFNWSLGGTISFAKTIVDKLPEGADYIPSAYNLILQEGQQVYTHYLVRYAGVNPANGRALYYDKDGNVTQVYNPSDAVPLKGKTVSPKFDGSINTKFSYKGFALSANLYYKYGNYILNYVESNQLSDGDGYQDNQRLDAFNYWKKPGDTDVLPDPKNPLNTSEISDRFLQDGSYLRLRSVRLGYTLPKKWLTFITAANIYVQGKNLWTYAPYFKGDPEVGIGSGETIGPRDIGFVPGAYNLYSYPTLQSFLLGINITF